MSVKFKLGFTVSAETLFTLMSKLLPIEDLSVEEVIERPPVPAHLDQLDTTVSKLIGKTYYKNKPKKKHSGGRKNVDLTRGVNAIIMGVLADGQIHGYSELRAAIAKTMYSPNGIGSRVDRLVALGYINRLGGGKYRAINIESAASLP